MPMVTKNKTGGFASKLLGWRMWIQASFLMVWLDPLGLRMHTMCSPVFHCYACPLATFACPIGVIAQFGALHVFPFVAVGLLKFVRCVHIVIAIIAQGRFIQLAMAFAPGDCAGLIE